jgi:low affinity Fe/Cu permease
VLDGYLLYSSRSRDVVRTVEPEDGQKDVTVRSDRAIYFAHQLRNKLMTQDTEHWFSKAATITSNGSGRPWAFGIAGGFVLCWLLTGPIFHFSDTWQLVMNTISSIVTFLMVFLIQNAQNRESSALQLKLDELIRVTEARNKLVGIEQRSEKDIEHVREEMDSDNG